MSKKRVSLTLEESLVERIDREADREGVNRSRMVEEILRDHFRQKSVSRAVVFCGDPEAKALRYYEGKTVLEYILENLSEEGIEEVLLLIGKNREIEERFGDDFQGMKLSHVSEEEPEGTAAALKKVEDRIDGTFILLNGHVITEVDLEEMLRTHRNEETVATMALTTVEDPSSYGVARMKGSKILGFDEKPEKGEEPSRLINAGVYVLETEIFRYLEGESVEEAFEKLSDSGELTGYIYGGEWTDISEA